MNRRIALRFSKGHFEGTRERGYGDYRYAVRWLPIAEDIALHFDLKAADRSWTRAGAGVSW